MILCFDFLTLPMRFPPPFRHNVYMVLIEAKRFLSIVSPMKRLLNYSEKTWIFVCFTWVPSILFMSYYFCIYELVDTNNGMICNYK